MTSFLKMIARNIFACVFQFFPRKIIFLHLSRKNKKKKKKREKGIFSRDLKNVQTSSNQHYILSSILFLHLFLTYAHVYVL